MTKPNTQTTKPVTKPVAKLPIQRARLAGKRRFVLSLTDIARLSDTTIDILNDTIRRLPLRESIDYKYDDIKEDRLLALHTCQTLLASINTPTTWQYYHHITDFLQKINQRKNNDGKNKNHG